MSEEVANRFRFHPATPDTGQVHDAVRLHHGDLAEWIEENVPDSRERSLALTSLQESMMWCNAAVAYRP
jgi:hypothetical protein